MKQLWLVFAVLPPLLRAACSEAQGHATAGTGALYVDADNAWGDGTNYKEDPEPTTSANGQTAAVDAAYGIQATWDMYKHVFGRNGINGQGSPTYARLYKPS